MVALDCSRLQLTYCIVHVFDSAHCDGKRATRPTCKASIIFNFRVCVHACARMCACETRQRKEKERERMRDLTSVFAAVSLPVY